MMRRTLKEMSVFSVIKTVVLMATPVAVPSFVEAVIRIAVLFVTNRDDLLFSNDVGFIVSGIFVSVFYRLFIGSLTTKC